MMLWIRLIEIKVLHIEWENHQELKLLIKSKHLVQDLEIMKIIKNSAVRGHSFLSKARINQSIRIKALDLVVMNPIQILLKIT